VTPQAPRYKAITPPSHPTLKHEDGDCAACAYTREWRLEEVRWRLSWEDGPCTTSTSFYTREEAVDYRKDHGHSHVCPMKLFRVVRWSRKTVKK